MARTLDVDVNHLTETLRRAAAHKGTAFVEVYQNCKIFNDGVFEYATDKSIKADNALYLEHGKPLIFGKDRNKGIRLHGLDPDVVELGNGIAKDDLLVHDEKARNQPMGRIGNHHSAGLRSRLHPRRDIRRIAEYVGLLARAGTDHHSTRINADASP